MVLEAKTEEKNTLMESIDELKEGLETKKGEVKKMENDLVGEFTILFHPILSSKVIWVTFKSNKYQQQPPPPSSLKR